MNIKLLNGYDDLQLTYSYFGLDMQQNNYAISYIAYLLNNVKPKTIIEFGTRTGGLSVLLQLYSMFNNAKFVTYDNEDSPHIPSYKDLFQKLQIDFRREDITSDKVKKDISSLIESTNGTTILFCDAGKHLEFNIYTDKLKSGDIAMCHDYFYDENSFNEAKNARVWHTQECKHSDVIEAVNRNNMKLILNDVFILSAWGIYQKQ